MSTVHNRAPGADVLEEVSPPHEEPRVAHAQQQPRKVNNLTLIDGKTFLSTTVSGDICPPGAPDVGFFHDDTRFLSRLELRVGGQRTVVLSAATEKTFANQIELTTGTLALRDSFEVPENTLYIRRQQVLGQDVFHDWITFENFNNNEVDLDVELFFAADFVDVFQVRGVARQRPGHYFKPLISPEAIVFIYKGLDEVTREVVIEFAPAPGELSDNAARWRLRLPPLAKFDLSLTVRPRVQGEGSAARPGFSEILQARREAFEQWRRDSTGFRSSNDAFTKAIDTAASDFHALQTPVGKEHVIAAGIPWFATMFGRDSLIAAFQSLLLNPRLAVETLRVLAQYQGREHNDWRDEQPGKILHEYRVGEMTRAGEMPFGPYYGSVDSTPLFLILLSETYNWTADADLVRELLPAAYAALEWIDRYGDLDGDGLVEYVRRSPRGLVNQAWKDSWDAYMHADGRVAPPPIASVEVQGYVYDAKYRMALLLRSFGDADTADRLKKEAAAMAQRIDEALWMPKRNFYAMALDREKKQLQVVSSNPGHLLFSRAISKDRARAVVARLMQSDMFSGWGWRTISGAERVFNPLSYHRGSVWPHDNSLIGHGMALNDFRDSARRIFTTLFQAAVKFRDSRLPELFCGVQRRQFDEPVHYPVSCSPQAWASGSMFLFLTSLLGITPAAPRKELNIVNPVLPEWLEQLSLRNLRIGNSRVGLDFSRRGERTFCNLVDVDGEKLTVNIVFRK